MAQLFPMNGADDAPASLTRTLRALPEPWTLLCNRQIAGADGTQPVPVDLVLVHPEIGVALVDEAPRDPTPAVAAFRDYLATQRFSEFCPGDLPIVALSVPIEEAAEAGERLAAAFDAAPLLSIVDRDWADAIIELLLIPDDLAMAPAAAVEGAAAPGLAEEEPELPPEIRPMRPDLAPADAPMTGALDRTPETDPWESLTDWESPRIPLRVDWPIVASAAAAAAERRRRRLAGAAILGLLLVGGAAGAAWQLAREEPRLDEAALAPPPQDIEIPLAPPLVQHPSAPPPAPPREPPAQPVILAAKPLALLPPPPPVPTPVEALPRVAAKAPALPSPSTVVPTPPKATASATPAPLAMRPAAVARRQPPALDHANAASARREARAEPSRRPPAETRDGPPIDATELPPAALAYTVAPRARREAHAEPNNRPPAETSNGPPIDATELPPLDTPVTPLIHQPTPRW